MKDDWFVNPKTNEEVTFIDFARSEGRFAKHFDKDGNPSETLLYGEAGPAGELASAAGTGGAAVMQVDNFDFVSHLANTACAIDASADTVEVFVRRYYREMREIMAKWSRPDTRRRSIVRRGVLRIEAGS